MNEHERYCQKFYERYEKGFFLEFCGSRSA